MVNAHPEASESASRSRAASMPMASRARVRAAVRLRRLELLVARVHARDESLLLGDAAEEPA
jgi:hypothetical protein